MTDSTPQGHRLGHFLARKHRERRPTRPKQGLQVCITRQVSTLNVLASSQQPKQQGKTITLAGTSILDEQQHHASILSLSMLPA